MRDLGGSGRTASRSGCRHARPRPRRAAARSAAGATFPRPRESPRRRDRRASRRRGSARCPRSAPRLTSIRSSAANRSLADLASASIRARRRGVEMSLIEQADGVLDDGRDDPRLRHDAPHRADGTAACPPRDLADLELEPRGAGERVSPLGHRRRAGVGGLPVEGDAMALDAERAEHGSEGQPHRLEHRPLLDVQLEVGGCALELPPCLRACGRARRPCSRQRVRKRDTVASRSARSSSWSRIEPARRTRPEQATPEPRALLVGPVDEPDRDGRRPVGGDPAQHLEATDDVQAAVQPAAVRHGVDVAPDQDGTLGFAGERCPLVARLVDLDLDRERRRASLSSTRGPRPTYRSSRRAARRPRRRSAPEDSRSSATVRDGSSATAAIYRSR